MSPGRNALWMICALFLPLRAIFLPPAATAAAERKRIGASIALMEKFVGDAAGT